MPSMISQRHDFASFELAHHVFFDSHVASREDTKRNIMAIEFDLQVLRRRSNKIPGVVLKVPQLVRRDNDDADAILNGHTGHLQGLI